MDDLPPCPPNAAKLPGSSLGVLLRRQGPQGRSPWASILPSYTSFLTQASTLLWDWAASAPWMEIPFSTVAPQQARFKSPSLSPRPLPSLVQKGQIRLPDQS